MRPAIELEISSRGMHGGSNNMTGIDRRTFLFSHLPKRLFGGVEISRVPRGGELLAFEQLLLLAVLPLHPQPKTLHLLLLLPGEEFKPALPRAAALVRHRPPCLYTMLDGDGCGHALQQRLALERVDGLQHVQERPREGALGDGTQDCQVAGEGARADIVLQPRDFGEDLGAPRPASAPGPE
jgi:hypothetical protein